MPSIASFKHDIFINGLHSTKLVILFLDAFTYQQPAEVDVAMLILILASVLVSTILVAHLRKMAPFYILSKKVPGPYAFPLIGSAWEFMNKNSEELMQTLIAISKKYPSPLRFWLGPKFVLIVHDCENARTILSSNRMNTKGDVYRFMEPLLGNGLITSSGGCVVHFIVVIHLELGLNHRSTMERTQKNDTAIYE